VFVKENKAQQGAAPAATEAISAFPPRNTALSTENFPHDDTGLQLPSPETPPLPFWAGSPVHKTPANRVFSRGKVRVQRGREGWLRPPRPSARQQRTCHPGMAFFSRPPEPPCTRLRRSKRGRRQAGLGRR